MNQQLITTFDSEAAAILTALDRSPGDLEMIFYLIETDWLKDIS